MPEWLTLTAVVALTIAVISAIAKFSRWSGQVDSDRASFKKFMDEMTGEMKEVRNDIKKIFQRLPPERLTASSSPVQLTNRGKRIADESGMDKLAVRLAPGLLAEVNDFEPFEVHDFCLDYVKVKLPEPERRELARGAFSVGISKDDLGTVLAILLRNQLLRLLEHDSSSIE